MNRLFRDIRGATTLELAVILPVFLMLVFGIMQLGMVFQGQASMSHALGEGARMATIYPTPTDAVIKKKMEDEAFSSGNFGTYEVSNPSRTGIFMTLKVKYTMPMNFFMMPLPDVVLVKEKVVYTSSKVS